MPPGGHREQIRLLGVSGAIVVQPDFEPLGAYVERDRDPFVNSGQATGVDRHCHGPVTSSDA